MNDYSKRSQYYRSEFKIDDDFNIIESLLSKTDGALAEMPCGSGRLLPIYKRHTRRVYMVDREPTMIEQLKLDNPGDTIIPIVGDIKEWQSDEPLNLVLFPRGGIQLLGNIHEFITCLRNVNQNLRQGGWLYIDIANPWNFSANTYSILPNFMRFDSTGSLSGSSEIEIANGKLIRQFQSSISDSQIVVDFIYTIKEGELPEREHFTGKYQWIRILKSDIEEIFNSLNFQTVSYYGDYDFAPYTSESSRIIIVAQKSNL